MRNDETSRPLTEFEAELLGRLLSAATDDREKLLRQSASTRARTIDSYGSFALDVPGSEKEGAQVPHVEAQTQDIDGVPVWITLFLRGGVLDEVEIVRADGSSLLRSVDISALDIFQK